MAIGSDYGKDSLAKIFTLSISLGQLDLRERLALDVIEDIKLDRTMLDQLIHWHGYVEVRLIIVTEELEEHLERLSILLLDSVLERLLLDARFWILDGRGVESGEFD